MTVGEVRPVDIDSEMRQAYLDYAMSVIVSRALPDARDGLKPVHRRILYAMYDMGLRQATPYRKSARIVGEVLGKYHPHGDAAVYDAMVRLAQDFSMRYPLVDGQGNFGSIDGDSAAAMRYTEARMMALGEEILLDIDKNTVDFEENFDGSLREPTVLPTAIPNLLVNGSSGIAVGMSTSIPPHNMIEVCDALNYMIDNWDNLADVGLPELTRFIKGPDFPTGGLVFRYGSGEELDNLAQAYGTGRGKVIVQARAHIEQMSRGRNRIIITELPYQVNKTSLLERIADLAREERLEGLTDLRDESDRHGLRIVIDLTRNADPESILKHLYKLTPMRTTFSIIFLALVDGEPRMLTIKQALKVYLEHRLEVVRRRSEYDLERARERAHILEGYVIALDNLDQVIEVIRHSRTVETARDNLRKTFRLSEVQAQAILDMPLRRLAALERKRIEDEYKQKIKLIAWLDKLLSSPPMMRGVIKEELTELKRLYPDPRRTVIVDDKAGSAVTVTELLPDEQSWIVITRGGLISRSYNDQAPRVTQSVKDSPVIMLSAGSSDTIYLFTNDGMAATLHAHQIPQLEDFEQGLSVSSLVDISSSQRVVAALARPYGLDKGFLNLETVDGMIKRIALEELPGITTKAFRVIGLADDELGWALWTSGGDELVLVSAEGKAIRFSEEEIRPMGLPAGGVKSIKLGSRNDQVVGLVRFDERESLWVITRDGTAKSSRMIDYPLQGRYGQGVITYKFKDKGSRLAAVAAGRADDNLVVVTSKGKPKYMRFEYAPSQGRNATGENIIALGENETVTTVVTFQSRAEPVPEPDEG